MGKRVIALALLGGSASCHVVGSEAAPAGDAAPREDAAPPADASTTPVACDPLAPAPTALAKILGVGKDASGTLYVVDDAGQGQLRVFVSNGQTLERQHVLGTGAAGGGASADGQYSLSFDSPDGDGSDGRTLLLDVHAGAADAMALDPGLEKGLPFVPDSGAAGRTVLAVVDASAVTGQAIQNLPGVVEYMGDVSNGEVLVVTAPVDLASTDDFRIFYGPAADEQEGTITNFVQALSGYPQITFTLGGATYTMAISTVYGTGPEAGPLGQPGPGTLSVAGGPSLAFTLRQPPPTALPGFRFTCHAPS
jgi:hypothetical protein